MREVGGERRSKPVTHHDVVASVLLSVSRRGHADIMKSSRLFLFSELVKHFCNCSVVAKKRG